MILLKNINGRYHSDYKFILKTILALSSSGLYRGEKEIIKTITNSVKAVDTSITKAQNANQMLIDYKACVNLPTSKLKKNASNSYIAVCNSTSDLYQTFYDIRENGSNFGKNLISREIMLAFLKILEKTEQLKKMTPMFDLGTSITKITSISSMYMGEIETFSKDSVKKIEEQYKEMNKNYSDFAHAFWPSSSKNSIHTL